jgi:hypothetical protein
MLTFTPCPTWRASRALREHLGEHPDALAGLEHKVDEPRAGHVDAPYQALGQVRGQLLHQGVGDGAGRLLQRLRQHKREIGREIAVRGIAGRGDIGGDVERRADAARGLQERLSDRLLRPHLPPESDFFLALSELL